MIVCKFGGTSTIDLLSIQNIQKLSKNNRRKIFVFSAIGKNKKDEKLTDLLIEYCNCNKQKELNDIYNKIENKFINLIKITKQNINIKYELNKIIKRYKQNKCSDYLISRGEYLTAKIMSKYLNIKFVPAEYIIYFKNNKLNNKKILIKLNYYLSKYKRIVIPGFYGVDENKNIKLFSRGGSDITGAIVAKFTDASIYENWTDINGVMQVNPEVIKSKQILKMNYHDLNLMTSCDAKVIHNDCVQILQDTNIKLYVKNIFEPNCKPTKIYKSCRCNNMFICYKKDDVNVSIIVNHKSRYKGVIHCTTDNYKSIIQNLYQISC